MAAPLVRRPISLTRIGQYVFAGGYAASPCSAVIDNVLCSEVDSWVRVRVRVMVRVRVILFTESVITQLDLRDRHIFQLSPHCDILQLTQCHHCAGRNLV